MKRMVVEYKYLPARLPVVGTAVAWLLLDRLHAPDLVRGIVWTVYAIVWADLLAEVFMQKPCNPFGGRND